MTTRAIKNQYYSKITLYNQPKEQLSFKLSRDNEVIYGKKDSLITSQPFDENGPFSFYAKQLPTNSVVSKYQQTPDANKVDNIFEFLTSNA